MQSDIDIQPQLLRIDELAQLAALPSRTIRFYNTQGLLPAPILRGRTAYYSQEHVIVLRIIRDLKEQQNLPLDAIKQLLEIRAHQGDVQMNLALKQRHLRTLSAGGSQMHLTQEELAQQAGISTTQIEELTGQGLLFPIEDENGKAFTGDDLLLLELYQHIEELGLPVALPALIRFQMRQLVRSELAAYEQHLLPRWREADLTLEQQTEQFEKMVTLTDTLISLIHRKLLYSV